MPTLALSPDRVLLFCPEVAEAFGLTVTEALFMAALVEAGGAKRRFDGTKAELAAMLGCSARHVFRLLRRLKRRQFDNGTEYAQRLGKGWTANPRFEQAYFRLRERYARKQRAGLYAYRPAEAAARRLTPKQWLYLERERRLAEGERPGDLPEPYSASSRRRFRRLFDASRKALAGLALRLAALKGSAGRAFVASEAEIDSNRESIPIIEKY